MRWCVEVAEENNPDIVRCISDESVMSRRPAPYDEPAPYQWHTSPAQTDRHPNHALYHRRRHVYSHSMPFAKLAPKTKHPILIFAKAEPPSLAPTSRLKVLSLAALKAVVGTKSRIAAWPAYLAPVQTSSVHAHRVVWLVVVFVSEPRRAAQRPVPGDERQYAVVAAPAPRSMLTWATDGRAIDLPSGGLVGLPTTAYAVQAAATRAAMKRGICQLYPVAFSAEMLELVLMSNSAHPRLTRRQSRQSC